MYSTMPTTQRRTRAPQHPFNVRHAPYEIQPFFIAPVLAGETMQVMQLQSRALTNPIKAPLIGWWLEHFFFYVKLSDIDEYQNEFGTNAVHLRDMLINDTTLTTHEDWRAAAAADRFYGWVPDGAGTATGMDYVRACLKAVVVTFFRDGNAAYDEVTIDGNPAAYLMNTSVFDSAMLETAMDAAIDVTIETTEQEGTPNVVTVSARDIANAMQSYQLLYEQGLINITYEDYLRQEGIRVPEKRPGKPELIRYSRDWQYPSSHVVPDTVTAGDSDVTSAVSWVITSRADKARFFREPGFLFGVTVARPKTYLQAQKRPLVTMMFDSADWLPVHLRDQREAGWKQVTDGATDPIGGVGTGNWWFDVRDLFMHGEQFIAGDAVDLSSATDLNKMAAPTADLNARWPIQASVDALFVSADATGGVRQDGIVRPLISSRVRDLSPRGADVRLVR